MSITSYAQNFEDVMLWRALGHVPNGFYIDLGAQHPVVDSISRAFYEHGWRGLHVEATPAYANLLRQDRPDETVIQAAVNDKHGTITFFEIQETGISTGDADIAESHKARGFKVLEITVPCITLFDVFSHVESKDIHWLKIDVEGMEQKVLQSWGKSKVKPWIVIVESTLPLTQVENHHLWENHLIDRGYIHVYFDGLNRYYLSPTQLQLKSAFSSGPNVFDGFALHGSASAPFCAYLNEKHHQVEQTLQQQVVLLNQQKIDSLQHFDATIADVSGQLRTANDAQQRVELAVAERALKHATLERELLADIEKLQAQIVLIQQEVEDMLRIQLQREQTNHVKWDAFHLGVAQEAVENKRLHEAEKSELRNEYIAREQLLQERLKTEQTQRWRLQQETSAHEKTLYERVQQAQFSTENLLQKQVERERELAGQLISLHQKSAQENTELIRVLAKQQTELNKQLIYREQVLQDRADDAQLEFQKLLRVQLLHEQSIFENVNSLCTQAAEDRNEFIRVLTEQQTAFHNQQIDYDEALIRHRIADQGQYRQLQQDYTELELLLKENINDIKHQVNTLLEVNLLRESETALQLQAEKQRAEHEKAALQETHTETIDELNRYQERLNEVLNHLQALQTEALQHQHKTNDQLAAIKHQAEQSAQKVLRLHREGERNFNHQHAQNETILTQMKVDYAKVLGVCASLEAQLISEVKSGQTTMLTLSQGLAEVQQSLNKTHTSFSGKTTASLRNFAKLFDKAKNQLSPSIVVVEAIAQKLEAQTTSNSPAFSVDNSLGQLDKPRLKETKKLSIMPTTISTLPELLACNDQQFVHCAYETLLRREPDPEGMAYYLGRLRTGFSKMTVVAQLRLSDEGKNYVPDLPDLDAAIKRHQKGRYPLIGWFFRQFSNMDGDSSSERRLRAIQNQIFLISEGNQQQFNKFETVLAGIHHLVAQQTKSAVTELIDSPLINSNISSRSSSQPAELEGLNQLSPSAKDIYLQFKTAAVINNRRSL